MNIRILREAGGIGDVVCTLPVARAAKGKWSRDGGTKLYYFGIEDYRDLVEHCPDIDVFVPVPPKGRRPRDRVPDPAVYPYLAGNGLPEFHATLDCWCPAFRYERARGPEVSQSRIESFCDANGLKASDCCPHYVVTDGERAWARGWIEGQGFDRKPVVGLQPFSTNSRRDWPLANWIDLAQALLKQGTAVIVFHSFLRKVRDVPGRKATGLALWKVAALLAQCDCVVTPDSGLFHLAAAVETPALGLFGSTSAEQTAKHYPLHKTLWPKDEPRGKECRTPCHCFEWCGCDGECAENGCEILSKIMVPDVLDTVRPMLKNRES